MGRLTVLFSPSQRRLDDFVGHTGVLPFDEVVRREGLRQRLAVDVVDQEVRREPLLLELDEVGQQVRGGDRRLGGRRGGRSGGDGRRALAQPGALETGLVDRVGVGLLEASLSTSFAFSSLRACP
jgi:hypothetical protein